MEPAQAARKPGIIKAKVVVVGRTGVGKTSIILRHDGQGFCTKVSATVGASFIVSSQCVDGQRIDLQIWDTAGQERYMSLIPMYLRNAVGALLVYDITARDSFNDLKKWIDELNRGSMKPLSIFVIGNKTDLEGSRVVSVAEGEHFAQQHGAPYFETSAFNGQGINRVMCYVATRLVEQQGADTPSYILLHEEPIELPTKRKKPDCCTS